ncbi:MAG: WYL domain-containing protein [Desulfosalsimonadaceae bacterium]
MQWSAQKRIEFIEARLYWDGKISRKDLTEFFGISIPQATKDLKKYSALAPENIKYDLSAKQYKATKNFNPKISTPCSEIYLTRLKLLQEKRDSNKFFNGIPPSFSVMPSLRRFVDKEILRGLLRAIHNNEAVKIYYQSMISPLPKERWISPHALGYDGSRWHLRGLCHDEKKYKDFNLGRILSINGSTKHVFDHSIDYEWHNEIDITIAPHPLLEDGPKSFIERDYCMEGGQITVSLKAAFFHYFKMNFGFRDGYENASPHEQQIILLNLTEIEAKIELLKSMTESKINGLPAFSH